MEVDIPLSTLPLQLEQAFVGCPLSFVRESLVPPRQTLDTAKNDMWTDPGGLIHESSRIDTNSIQIREIRVNSWTVTSVQAHFALGHLEGRGRSDFVSRRKVGRVSCRPQGAFVAGGARRRRLSWSRQ